MYHLLCPVAAQGWWRRHGQGRVVAKLAGLPRHARHKGWPGLHALAWKFLMEEHPATAQELWTVFGEGRRLPQAALVWTLGNGPRPCAHLALEALPMVEPTPQDLEDADSVVGQIRVWCAMMARHPFAQGRTANPWMRMLMADTCWHQEGVFADSAHAVLRRAALLAVHSPHGWIDALDTHALAHDRTAHAFAPVYQAALTQAWRGPQAGLRPQGPTDPYAVHTTAHPIAPLHP